jgi:hypothetical protein
VVPLQVSQNVTPVCLSSVDFEEKKEAKSTDMTKLLKKTIEN